MFYFDFVFVLYIILFFEVIIIIIESVYILMRYRKKGMHLGRWGSGENLGEAREGESIVFSHSV